MKVDNNLTPYASMNDSSEKEFIGTAGQAVPSPINFLKFGNALENMILANLMLREFTIHYNKLRLLEFKTSRIMHKWYIPEIKVTQKFPNLQ